MWHPQLGCLSQLFFHCGEDFLRSLKLGGLTSRWEWRLELSLLPNRFGISFLGLQSGRCLSLNFILLLGVFGRLRTSLLRFLEDA